MNAAVVLEALAIVQGPEGAARRSALMENVLLLRERLAALGFAVLGEPSAIVPVVLGDAPLSRLMTRHALENGAIVNLVEYPAVSRGSCRWRLQVMADHKPEQIERLAVVAKSARDVAMRDLGRDVLTPDERISAAVA